MLRMFVCLCFFLGIQLYLRNQVVWKPMNYKYVPIYVTGSKLLILVMVIPPLIGNPYNHSYINRYYWVDFPIPTIGKLWEFRPDGIYLPQPGRSCLSFLFVFQSASFNLSRNLALRPTTGCNEDGQQAYLRSRVIFAGKDVWRKVKHIFCLVVEPTHLKKNDRQNGNLPQIGAKINNV